MLRPVIPVQKRTSFDQRGNGNNKPCRLHVAEPLLMREDRWVSRHCSSRKWPQIDEAYGLNPLCEDLIEITDTVRLGLHLTIKLRQPLCPIALIRIQLPLLLFIKQMKLIDLHANLEKAEVELGPMIKADTPDRRAIEAQIDKVATVRADLEKADALFLLDIRMKLTSDQWKQLQTLRMNRMQHQGMRGDGTDGRGGWGQGRQRPGMGGPGGQFHRPMPGGPPPADTPEAAPAPPPAPGSGDTQ